MEGTIVNEGWWVDDDGVVAVATNMEKESKVKWQTLSSPLYIFH